MNDNFKISILCSDQQLGEATFAPLSSMPTDSEISSLHQDRTHTYDCKTIDDHFLDGSERLKKYIEKNNTNHFFCYISDRVATIQGKRYIFTLACTAFLNENIICGTSGLCPISDENFSRLQAGEITPDHLYDTPVDVRAKEATNNAR